MCVRERVLEAEKRLREREIEREGESVCVRESVRYRKESVCESEIERVCESEFEKERVGQNKHMRRWHNALSYWC